MLIPEVAIDNPLKQDVAGLPPMLIQGATGDPQREDADQLAERADDSWASGPNGSAVGFALRRVAPIFVRDRGRWVTAGR